MCREGKGLPARRRCWCLERWGPPSSLGGSCCCHCWPGGRGEGGEPPESGHSPAFGGHTLETPQRGLGGKNRDFFYFSHYLDAVTGCPLKIIRVMFTFKERIQLLTNICIPVIFNNFSQLKMAGHNGHLIKKKKTPNLSHKWGLSYLQNTHTQPCTPAFCPTPA